MVSRALLLLALLLGGLAVASAELAVPPPPTRRINDYAGALPAGERERLEEKLAERERTSSNQVVVAIFPSLRGESLEDYSIRLAQAWRIGQKGLDNGVILLVFLEDRRMRLEVGYGLEPTLTDALAASIIRDVVAPRFREGRLADGIEAGLDAIAQAIAGTYQAPAAPARGTPSALPATPALVFGVLLLILGIGAISEMVRTSRARRRGWTGGGRGWYAPPPVGSSWGGGGWSSGGASSGGFTGGGGRFGGGGASGGW